MDPQPHPPTFKAIARDTQHGGIANRGAALCAHLGREFFAYGRASKQCCSQLYVDIIGAFDSVLRQLLVDVPLTDEVIAFVFKTVSMTPDD